MKRLVCICLSMILLSCCLTAGAAEQRADVPAVTILRRQVTIAGQAEPGSWLTLFVSTKEKGSTKNEVLLVNETGTEQTGEFKFSFDMPEVLRNGESVEREYYYRIGRMGGNMLYSGNFAYEIPLSLADALETLGQCQNAQAVGELLSQKKYQDLFLSLNVYMEEYQVLQVSGKEAIGEFLLEANPKESTFGEFVPQWNERILLRRMAESSKDGATDLLEKYDFQIKFSDAKIYSQLSDGEKQAVVSKLAGKSFTSCAELGETADMAYGLYQVENTSYQNLHPVITLYANTFQLSAEDIAYLNGLSADRQSGVYRIFKQKLAAQTSVEPQTVGTLIKDSVKEETENQKKPTSGGSSGGSGGGGSSFRGNVSMSLPGGDSGIQSEYQKDETPHNFDDMGQASWATEAVTALSNKGIIRGTALRTFEPNRNITRAECLKIVLTAFELATHEYSQQQPFEDVALDSWYFYYVTSGVRLGIVNGTGSGVFEPDREITREEMASMFYRASMKGYVGYEKSDLEKESFTDQSEISDYAVEAVLTLQQHGVLSGMGDGRFAPQATATRAETAQMVYNLLHTLELL